MKIYAYSNNYFKHEIFVSKSFEQRPTQEILRRNFCRGTVSFEIGDIPYRKSDWYSRVRVDWRNKWWKSRNHVARHDRWLSSRLQKRRINIRIDRRRVVFNWLELASRCRVLPSTSLDFSLLLSFLWRCAFDVRRNLHKGHPRYMAITVSE